MTRIAARPSDAPPINPDQEAAPIAMNSRMECAGSGRQAVSIRLPMPPSVNALFFNRPGGRGKTQAYRRWITQAGWELKLQNPKSILGQVEIDITLQDTGKRKSDADNRIKALQDLLVTHQVIQADDKSIVRKVSVGWDEAVVGAHVLVRPTV